MLADVQSFVWGPPLIILLVGTGLYLTVLLRGIQFRQLKHSLWLALIKRREEGAEGDISHFQALMTALAATVGTGNIVGVATAIAAGGPGALFWMWMTGLVGMATKYSEAVLGVRFRETDERGEKSGGPMYYLENGIRWGGVGKLLAVLFAVFASIAAFGIGNGVQSQAVADALNRSFSLPHWLTGLVVAACVGAVILGGIKSIGRFTAVFVPMMIILYMGAAGLVILLNIGQVPEALRLVFQGAFTPRPPAGRDRLHRGAGCPLRCRSRGVLQRVGARHGRDRRRRGADQRARAAGDGLDDSDLHRHDRRLLLHRTRDPDHRVMD